MQKEQEQWQEALGQSCGVCCGSCWSLCARFMICFVFFILVHLCRVAFTVTTFSFIGNSWSWWYLGFLELSLSSLWSGKLLPQPASIAIKYLKKGAVCEDAAFPSRPRLSGRAGQRRPLLIFTIPWGCLDGNPRSKTAKSARVGIQVYKYCLKTSEIRKLIVKSHYSRRCCFSPSVSHSYAISKCKCFLLLPVLLRSCLIETTRAICVWRLVCHVKTPTGCGYVLLCSNREHVPPHVLLGMTLKCKLQHLKWDLWKDLHIFAIFLVVHSKRGTNQVLMKWGKIVFKFWKWKSYICKWTERHLRKYTFTGGGFC